LLCEKRQNIPAPVELYNASRVVVAIAFFFLPSVFHAQPKKTLGVELQIRTWEIGIMGTVVVDTQVNLVRLRSNTVLVRNTMG
jgi:hypothetical protein